MLICLFTNIEGSTKKWEKYPKEMKQASVKHDSFMKKSIAQFGGTIIKHTGFGVFENSTSLSAAIELQKQSQDEKTQLLNY
jgi:class 3 adenylate cyclase